MTERLARIAVVDDSEPDRVLLLHYLRRAGLKNAIRAASSVFDLPRFPPPDVVVLDLSMPDVDGHQAMVLMRSWWPSCRYVIHSGWARGELSSALAASLGVAAQAGEVGGPDIAWCSKDDRGELLEALDSLPGLALSGGQLVTTS